MSRDARRVLALLGSTLMLPAAVTMVAPAAARGDDSVVHHVTYTVIADHPLDADIYYRDVDPPNWADYSHNPYLFSPRDEATLGPGTRWVRDVALTDPERWAMVAISRVSTLAEGAVRCELAVDGVIVDTAEGPAGAVCSLRHW
jgi:hypothetical protein